MQPQVVELQSPIELDLKIGKLPIKNVCTNVGIRVGATEKVVRADFHVIPMTCDFILGDAFHDVVQVYRHGTWSVEFDYEGVHDGFTFVSNNTTFESVLLQKN